MDLIINNSRHGLHRKPLQQLNENQIQSHFKTTTISGKCNDSTTKPQNEKLIPSVPTIASSKTSVKRRRHSEEKDIENDDASETDIKNSQIFASKESNSNLSTTSPTSIPTNDHILFISTPNINSRPPLFPTSNENNSTKNSLKKSSKEQESPQISPQIDIATHNICSKSKTSEIPLSYTPLGGKLFNASSPNPNQSPSQIFSSNKRNIQLGSTDRSSENKIDNKNIMNINSKDSDQNTAQTENYFLSMIASEMNELDEIMLAAAALSKKLKLRKECFDKQQNQVNSKNKGNHHHFDSSTDKNEIDCNKNASTYQSLNKFVSLETGESIKCSDILSSHLIATTNTSTAATPTNTIGIISNNNKNDDVKLSDLNIPIMSKSLPLTNMSTVQSKLHDWKSKYGETTNDSPTTTTTTTQDKSEVSK